jgi:DEAD/DEAH box helicase domain-containing protein
MTSMKQAFETLIAEGVLTILETIETPPRPERRRALPARFHSGPIGGWLRANLGQAETAWNHQSLALEKIAAGANVVVATGTASGKSLIFQLAVLDELLNGDGKAIIIYPLKALLADQLSRWRALVVELGLPEDIVAELHGDVMMEDRNFAIRNARVLVMTPDLLQAWFMHQVSAPAVNELLCKLRYLVIDEAHVYESVFGSNVAYLIRRFLVAKKRACRARRGEVPLQIIAATATIYDPQDHMHCLTGWDFDAVMEQDDGSPTYGRTLLHVDGPDLGATGEQMLTDVIARACDGVSAGSFLAFHNSRQGVERVTRALAQDDILPYRSGYEAKDRTRIENQLRAGALRGVVATSALELGIDVKGFTVGLNLGVPQSRKAFRQRLGRVGRSSHGVFAVIAPRHAFTRFGSSFAEYYQGSVEPSYLYLDNRFIQFAHARCLMDESEQLGFDQKEVPPGISWPTSFARVYELARPGIRRPKEFDVIAAIGADSPHYNYPLRQVGEANYKLKEGSRSDPEQIGGIALNQAIREAYPGALYLHMKRPMKVREWRSSSFDRSIRLEEAKNTGLTRPILHKSVNVGASSDDVVGGRVMTGPTGLLAEVSLQVNESVLGYQIGGTTQLYRDLRATNPAMTRKQREFGTTGVILRIDEPWFAGGSGSQPAVRAALSEALKQLLLREKSIAPNDVDNAHTHIAFYDQGIPRRATDTIVIYDSIYGGLRLTEPLFSDFEDFIDRLGKAADLAGAGAFVTTEVVANLKRWFDTLEEGLAAPTAGLVAPDGEIIVFAPGSEVSARVNGMLVERTLIEPRLFPIGNTQMLMYRYEGRGDGECWVPHEQLEATGQDWKQVFWNPHTGKFTDPEELSESSF